MIVKTAKSNSIMSSSDFRDKFAPGISVVILDCILFETNIKKWLLKNDHCSNLSVLKKEVLKETCLDYSLTKLDNSRFNDGYLEQ